MSYQQCIGWTNLLFCDDSLPGIASLMGQSTSRSPCTEMIDGNRSGYCLCHDQKITVPKECGHDPFRCDAVCANATMGCKDPIKQLAASLSFGDVALCDGAWDWNESGLIAAEQALCDVSNGFHICSDEDEVEYLGVSESDCGDKPGPNTFYLTKLTRKHRIFGCGNVEQYDQLPVSETPSNGNTKPLTLSMFDRKMEREQYINGSWKLKDEIIAKNQDNTKSKSSNMERRIYKTNKAGGGVMCCREKERKYTSVHTPGNYDRWHILRTIFIILWKLAGFMMLSVVVVILMRIGILRFKIWNRKRQRVLRAMQIEQANANNIELQEASPSVQEENTTSESSTDDLQV